MPQRPRYSIVIPTRDRPDLLEGAVRSALAQTLEDVEVVVSDNGTEGAAAAVAEGFRDARVRVVRTPRPLLMHASWDFAVTAARGEWVTILCDDDALHPRALELADRFASASGAEVISWRSCSCGAADAPDPALRGLVRFGPPCADRAFRLDGARLLDGVYDLRVSVTDLVPKWLNAAVARSLIARAGERLFRPSCPDYAGMLLLAAHARGMVLLDAPLLVAGATGRSIGASALARGEVARRYEAELRAAEPGLVLPEHAGPVITWLAQTAMQCAHDVPALRGREVNRVHLYALAIVEIERAAAEGLDVEAQRRGLDAAFRGPLAGIAPAARSLAASGRSIESEEFIGAPLDAGSVLGLGAFRAEPAGADAIGGLGLERVCDVAAVAAGLDPWLEREAQRLDGLARVLARRAAGRTPVLYGLGLNGRALLRILDREPRSLLVTDDAPGPTCRGRERVEPASLDPARHGVLITPSDPEPIRRRLESRGFVAGRDFATLDAAAGARS